MSSEFSVINYPGSKRSLLNFIDDKISKYIPKDKALLDIFGGSGAVSYFYKKDFKVYANDSEEYSYVLLDALLRFKPTQNLEELLEQIKESFRVNNGELNEHFDKLVSYEEELLYLNDAYGLEDLYSSFPNIWKGDLVLNGKTMTIKDLKDQDMYALFTTYYSGSYFGIYQGIEIDSLRYAIEKSDINLDTKNMLLSSLFYAMKEVIFSKDGHMAQPLGLNKNHNKLLHKRKISIYDKFETKVKDFYSQKFNTVDHGNRIFNFKFEELLENKTIFNDVGFIYADPPYTDMQYSRYFHLLNTLVNYSYQEMAYYRGNLSKGLYTENRYQSPLSQKSRAIEYHKCLFDFCYENKIGLAFSFAYPADPDSQQTNRYVLDINDLIIYGNELFGENFRYFTQNYAHSNNRNSASKQVLEYLLVYTP